MPSSVLALLCVGFLSTQEPSAELARSLADQSAAIRRLAAEQLGTQGESAEAWIMAQARKGAPERQRALLLAAALAGTDRTYDLLQDALKKGNRPDPHRAYALFLFGAYHPDGAEDPEKAIKMAASPFERSCYWAGLLTRTRSVPLATFDRMLSAKGEGAGIEATLRRWCAVIHGQAPASEPTTDGELAVALLGSVIPGNAALPRAWIENARGKLPPLWQVAAARSPARTLEALRAEPAGGEGSGLALALYELPADGRADAFGLLRERLVEPAAQAWLWGAAGDLQLDLPPQRSGTLADAEIAGLLRLAIHDPARAIVLAGAWRAAARQRFTAEASVTDHWPAAIVLALAPKDEEKPLDQALLQARIDKPGLAPEERARLHPIWQLATDRLSDPQAQAGWYRRWSRELHAGHVGFLDLEGRRLMAYLLVNGTQAARGRSELGFAATGLTGPRDHSRDDELYADLAELILSNLYVLDLP